MTKLKKSEKNGERPKRIYLLPNLLTTGSLYAAFYSMLSSISGHYFKAAVAVIISGLFDMMDGKVARLTNTTSQFGIEYDSLSDLVAFGVAPGLLVYLWALQPFGRLGLVISFIFITCGALRLARFNAHNADKDPEFFQGLAIPVAGGTIAASFIMLDYLGVKMTGGLANWGMLVFVIALSFLMVSNVKYPSFKGELIKNRPFSALVSAILILAMITVHPQITLFLFGMGYILSGPIIAAIYNRQPHELKEPFEV